MRKDGYEMEQEKRDCTVVEDVCWKVNRLVSRNSKVTTESEGGRESEASGR